MVVSTRISLHVFVAIVFVAIVRAQKPDSGSTRRADLSTYL